MSKVENGNTVEIHYRGLLSDGTEFDSSHSRGETLSFTVGGQEVLPAFSDAVVGMSVGDTKKFKLDAANAYGNRVDEAVQTVAKSVFPEGFEFIIGGTVQGEQHDGSQFLAKITEELEEEVLMDFNHPLAGEDLDFEVELVNLD
jgi:peptidylprolyl isomerase|tara:strand:- start:320 stop:751 length:432 start_codon:yes stop_codon:yes gene_type:complete